MKKLLADYNKYLDVDCPSLPDTSLYNWIGYEPFDE